MSQLTDLKAAKAKLLGRLNNAIDAEYTPEIGEYIKALAQSFNVLTTAETGLIDLYGFEDDEFEGFPTKGTTTCH